MSGTSPDRVLLPTATGAESVAALRTMLHGHRVLAAVAIGVLVAGTAVGLLTAPLLGHIVDLVVDKKGAAALTLPLVLLVVVAVARGAAAAVGSTLVARLGETVLAALREQFIERALRLPLDRVEAAGSGDLVSRVTSDVSMIGKSVRQALPEFSRSALTILLTFVGLAVLDWRFLIAALLASPVQVLSVRWYMRRAAPVYGEHRVATGALQHQLLDSVGGVRTVRAFRLDGTHTELLEKRSAAARDLGLRGIHIVTGFFSRLNLGEFIGLAAMLATGFFLVDDGSVSIGTATAAALYFHSLFNPINATLYLLDDAQSAGASFARLVGVSNLPAERAESEAHTVADGSVEVSGLSHAYGSGAPVLHEVDLRVRSGERVALVGASGAGKTTLAKLIAGVHSPTGGSIALGGIDTGELGPAGVRRAVALISQEVHVFAGTLADDLRLARPEADDEQLRAAGVRGGRRVGGVGRAGGVGP
ncbi:ABC transporter ATP-binding protein, partial [Streptomyces sp. NPDC059810]|uniref:ABC transporter ATP-binding protein n=1 Tax=Streptomyces sp. NPDC059810 TaxID=3346956 RepID=UPI00365E7442